MTDARLAEACAAIEDVLPRFTGLLRHNPGVTAMAVGNWTLPEVACHLSHAVETDIDVLTGGPVPDVELLPAAVTAWNDSMLDDDPERDLTVLADRIDALGARFLGLQADPPSDAVTWIGGTQLPPNAVAYHLLGKLLVHSYDVAEAARAPWRIAPAHAALAIVGAGSQSWPPGHDCGSNPAMTRAVVPGSSSAYAATSGPRSSSTTGSTPSSRQPVHPLTPISRATLQNCRSSFSAVNPNWAPLSEARSSHGADVHRPCSRCSETSRHPEGPSRRSPTALVVACVFVSSNRRGRYHPTRGSPIRSIHRLNRLHLHEGHRDASGSGLSSWRSASRSPSTAMIPTGLLSSGQRYSTTSCWWSSWCLVCTFLQRDLGVRQAAHLEQGRPVTDRAGDSRAS